MSDAISQDTLGAGHAPSISKVRLYEIDVLRGLAALAVVIYHYTVRLYQLSIPAPEAQFAFNLGHLGVHAFFIISGLVIYMSLANIEENVTRMEAVMRFVRSRFLRLYPLFWVCVLLTFGVVSLFGLEGREVSITALFANLTMLPRHLGFPAVDGVYWSLGVELFFYAFIVLSLILYRCLPSVLLTIWMVLALVSEWYLSFGAGVLGNEDARILPLIQILRFALILEWAPYFVIGITLYLQRERCLDTYARLNAAIASMIIVLQLGLVELCVMLLVYIFLYLTCVRQLLAIRSRVLVFLGTISYALYLVHQNVGYVLIRELYLRFQISHWASVSIALSLSLVLATFLTFLVERPLVAWIKGILDAPKRRLASGVTNR